MAPEEASGAIARAIIGSSLYMVLGTADADGNPWVSPVYYAHADFTRFYWVSSPARQHSRNLAMRPQLGIVVFDSGAAIYAGQAVYMSAEANEASSAERDDAIAIYSRRSQMHGAGTWTVDAVTGSAEMRLYVATASEHWILEPQTDHRIRVSP
jgi:uncharacterized protein YhbP (UPF0306 family)